MCATCFGGSDYVTVSVTHVISVRVNYMRTMLQLHTASVNCLLEEFACDVQLCALSQNDVVSRAKANCSLVPRWDC